MENSSFFKGHVLLCPYPAQGHITPTLQFAKRLASKGLKITLATTLYISRSVHIKDFKLGVETLTDAENEPAFIKCFREDGWRDLADIINKYNNSNDSSSEPISCLVCDAVFPQFLDVGKKFGLVTAAFFTQSCSVSTIFYHVKRGNLSVPVEAPTLSLPGLPLLHLQNLPSSVIDIISDLSLHMLSGQFSNLENADWLFFNTFDSLEGQVLKLMGGESWRIRSIGPTTPSMYLDKRIQSDTQNSLNIFTPSDDSYLEWLNGKEVGSVLYISFGSISQMVEEQMEELICGIKESNKDFIWIVRETERSKLPEGFAEEMRDKGLLLTWCSQLEVLAHQAIGCFLTHCGWNSTMEALSLAVPMVVMPHIWDQFTNAKFVEDVWGLGIRAKKDGKGIVRSEELVSCIREIMEGERGKVIKTNATRWRALAKDAVDEGGSSDLNVVEFVTSITSSIQENSRIENQ